MKLVKRPRPPVFENYAAILKTHFDALGPEAQQQLETRLTQVVVIGSLVLMTSFVYGLIPLFLRVFWFPVMIIGAWYLAGKSGPIIRWVWGRSLQTLLSRIPAAPALSYLGVVLVVAFFVVGILYGAGQS
ncbi:MAG: hypothetical protein K2X93_20675 [Candidatus Obscuribacterales bacterium]|nr:hypothetical protein [Candidatus Obscuribacterales bacterium]